MKILYYIHGLQVGGAETIVTSSLIELKKRGHNVILVVNEKKGTFLEQWLSDQNINLISLWPEKTNNYMKKIVNSIRVRMTCYRNCWEKIIKEQNPDIIHIHTFTDRFDPVGFPIKKIVYTFHAGVRRSLGLGSKENKEKIFSWSQQGMYFFALSAQMKEELAYLIKTNNIFFVPNGVDIQKIRNSSLSKGDFCNSVGIPEDSFIVGHVGRFHPVKNHRKLIEIFYEIRKQKDNAYLVLVGTGNKEEVQIVKSIISEYGVEEYVVLLGVRKDVGAVMSIMDVFLLTSTSESFSLVLIEAQAQNIRCITSDAVPREVICNENCISLGLDVPSKVWAQKALGNECNQNVQDIFQFDISNVIDEMICAYEKILDGNEEEQEK